ncbi:uncharacterized protein B0T23DRAFT_390904 [Neurospora hispaniola]|uniref:Uncharacterized protein n=1 Tax=Neurospora hispaniola TaxID=588809 RepID=A0AAJ0HY78_9PEZI|nr:hypothetical protein B0T23DRAFT_390904 [Neurospora hispaniola]
MSPSSCSYCWFLSRADDQLGPSTFLSHQSGLCVKNFPSKHLLEHHRMLLTVRGLETQTSTGLRLETLGTLALVFPENDAASRKWYRKQGERGENDMMILKCGLGHRKTRLEEYHYWHDRWLVLKEEFDVYQGMKASGGRSSVLG